MPSLHSPLLLLVQLDRGSACISLYFAQLRLQQQHESQGSLPPQHSSVLNSLQVVCTAAFQLAAHGSGLRATLTVQTALCCVPGSPSGYTLLPQPCPQAAMLHSLHSCIHLAKHHALLSQLNPRRRYPLIPLLSHTDSFLYGGQGSQPN